MDDPQSLSMWVLFLIIGVGTFLIRLSFIHLFGKIHLHPTLSGLLRYVPPAVLSALIVPAVLIQNGQIALSVSNGRITAAVVAAMIAIKSKNAILTICTGMVVLWAYQALL